MDIVAEGINDAWLKVIRNLEESGKESSPRGQKIKELQNVSVVIKDPKKRILSLPIRKMSLPYAFGEFLWYLSARNDVSMMEYYSKKMKGFSDDGFTLNSAYGYRIFGKHKDLPFDQWKFVVDKLQEDPDSRQAVIHLHTPNNKPTKDEVCTLSLQFFIREGKLDMVVNMRSNDIIWGFTYDVFNFTSLQELMANELNVEVGTYYHNAASMHIYEKDFSYFDYMTIYNELICFTMMDKEFSYEGLTIHSKEWESIIKIESYYRLQYQSYQISKNIFAEIVEELNGNKSLITMVDALYFYSKYKDNDRESIEELLDYDNLYHCMMRNYMTGKKLQESKLLIVDGSDGAGKSTLIKEMQEDPETNTFKSIAFGKPADDFNKQIYFYTALYTGDIVLDRFYYSEWVYSKVFKRKSRIDWVDVNIIERLLNFRNAVYMLIDTDPNICFTRLDEEDAKTFSLEQIKEIQSCYKTTFRVSNIKKKQLFNEFIEEVNS